MGFLDRASERSSHKGAIPKGGGIGLFCAFLMVSWKLSLPVAVWASIGGVSLMSFWGDSREISPKIRLAVQLIGSLCLVLGVLSWEDRNGMFLLLLVPAYALFVAGTANYYNFMDGINGIAGIAGGIAFGLICLFCIITSDPGNPYILFSACMAAACIGFLPFNIPNASVFMGDVGSILLGMVYAGFVVGVSKSFNDFLVLSSFLFPFYADELTTLYIRIKERFYPFGKNRIGHVLEHLMKPHRKHLYQLLANEMEITHWKVSLGYGIVQILVGIGALTVRNMGNMMVITFLGFCFLSVTIVSYVVRKRLSE